MMRLGHDVTIDMVEQYKEFIDWAFEISGRNREDKDIVWSFCTYSDGEPYVNFIYGPHVRFDQFEHRQEYERKHAELAKRKAEKKRKSTENITWKISYLSGGGTWNDCGTCKARLTDKTLTLSEIDSDRIRPKTEGGKVSCKREWCKEVTDEDFDKGEFYWYYLKAGIPHRFERIA